MYLQQQQKKSPSVRNSIPTEDTTWWIIKYHLSDIPMCVTYLIPMHGKLPRYGI